MLRSFNKRWLSFKPPQPLPFVDGKCRILANPAFGTAAVRMNAVLVLGTTYVGSRLVRFHAEMGWISLSFQSLAFLLGGLFTMQYYHMMRHMVVAVDLLETGKTIEITTSGFMGMTRTVSIEVASITDPRETPAGKLYMSALSSWAIFTEEKVFLISNTATPFHRETLEAILKGEEIEVPDKVDNQDIIDI